MKSLVIGGTGIIGNHVVRSLLDRGQEVRVFQRGITPARNLKNISVEIFQGDLNDSDSLQKAIKGCRWVFHTAPYYPTHTFDLTGHLKKAMQGLASVLKAVRANDVERFVYTSSLTTIGTPKNGSLADESCPYDLQGQPPHPYFELKYHMEEEVRAQAQKGLPAVIVNPTGCFGPYELKPKNLCLVPQLISGKIPAYVDRPMNAVDVADVGRGHVLAAEKGRVGERYILGGHNVSTRWLLETICRVGGVKPPCVQVPLSLALIPAWISEAMAHYFLGTVPVLPILGLRFVEHGQHFDLSKAQKELGYQVSPLEPCFERSIGWFREIGYCP